MRYSVFTFVMTAMTVLILPVTQAIAVPIGGSLLMRYDASVVTTAGTSVTNWQNQGSAGATLDASPISTSPTLVASTLNGQPVVRFTTGPAGATNNTLRTGPLGSDVAQPLTIIHVGLVTNDFDGNLSQQPFYYDGRVDLKRAAYYHAGGTTTSLYAGATASGGTVPIDTYNTWTSIFDGASSFLNQNGTPRFGPSNVNTQPIDGLTIGARFSGSNRLDGDIAELLVYSRLLNAAEFQITSNHYSAKYDLPVATNLYIGDDNANGDYDSNVFGVGNSAAITGFAAGSVTTGSDSSGLSITVNSGLDVGEFLMAGDDGTAHGLTPAEDMAGDRWTRIYYLDMTGDLNATLAFDFGEAGLPTPTGSNIYSLLYSATNAPLSWESVATGGLTGNQVQFLINTVQLGDGFYTLSIASVPEPSSSLLLGLGALGMFRHARRRKRA